MTNNGERYDVIIVGAGPAGLSAALVLGRCCRRVLVCDAGNPRNARSHGVHGFLTREGCMPLDLLAIGRRELGPYDVQLLETTVMSARRVESGFEVVLLDDSVLGARKLLLATGVVDKLPNVENVVQFYGKTIHHCPYCDGWEHRGGSIAVYGRGKGGTAMSLMMKTWTPDVVLCSNGASRLTSNEREKLARFGIEVYEKKIARLEGTGTKLESISFEDGTSIRRSAMFFSTGNVQRSTLPGTIGCDVTHKGAIKTTRAQRSSVPGVWVCGDAAEEADYAIIAAAEGAKAAMGINKELQTEDQA